MTVTIITCTGARPDAFALCEKYVARQTYKGPLQWIVVDDFPRVPTKCTMGQEVYQGPKEWREGINTQHFNMDEALKHVKGDYIFTFEDDDWYAPDYIETMLYFLQKFPIVGQSHSRYYALKDRMWHDWGNTMQCSLNETAMRTAEMLTIYEEAVNSGNLFFDIALWQKVRLLNIPFLAFQHIGLVCGMKQLPGKGGIGSGHRRDSELASKFKPDPGFNKLKEWVGLEDAMVYIDLAMGKGLKK